MLNFTTIVICHDYCTLSTTCHQCLHCVSHRELTAWISEKMAIISADELAHDLPGAEAMMTRYKEHRAEVDSRSEAFTKFKQTGDAFVRNGHFLSDEVNI